MSFFSKKTKITIHAFTRLVAQSIIEANPNNCQIIEESELFSNKEKEKIISELLYFRLVLMCFMLVFKGKFGSKHYDANEITEIIPPLVCMAFEDNGINKENALKESKQFFDRLQCYAELVEGMNDNATEEEVYFHFAQRFRDDVLGVDGDKLAERVEDEEYMLKHHEVFHYLTQIYHSDDELFKKGLKEFKFVEDYS